jgi:hypothetical protein
MSSSSDSEDISMYLADRNFGVPLLLDKRLLVSYQPQPIFLCLFYLLANICYAYCTMLEKNIFSHS